KLNFKVKQICIARLRMGFKFEPLTQCKIKKIDEQCIVAWHKLIYDAATCPIERGNTSNKSRFCAHQLTNCLLVALPIHLQSAGTEFYYRSAFASIFELPATTSHVSVHVIFNYRPLF